MGGCVLKETPSFNEAGAWVGWSDFARFAIFLNGHIAADHFYFYEFNSKNWQSFYFQKITVTLKTSIFENLLTSSFYFKRPKRKCEMKKVVNIFFHAPKMGKIIIYLNKVKKTRLAEFLIIFSFYKNLKCLKTCFYFGVILG